MLKINRSITFFFFSLMCQGLHSSQVPIPGELSLRYAELDELLDTNFGIVEFRSQVEPEFIRSCKCLGIDRFSINSVKLSQAYFQAIAKKDIDESLLCLHWSEYVKNACWLYGEIDRAYSYLVKLATQKNKLVKQIKVIQVSKESGIKYSLEDERAVLATIKNTKPEALSLLEDNCFEILISEFIDSLSAQQLYKLSKSHARIIINDSEKMAQLKTRQKEALCSNQNYNELTSFAAASTAK
ncbi:MAG: hypothetical protein NTZ68_03320 [Candidatus Dependentiae bacterium]|nr:hypothetical protein [Candidatus Dependentiae bacterium]